MQDPPPSSAAIGRPQVLFTGIVVAVGLAILVGALTHPRLWTPPVQLLLDIAELPSDVALTVSDAAGGSPLATSIRHLPTPYTLSVTATGARNDASAGTDVYFVPPWRTHTPPETGAPASMEAGWAYWGQGGRWLATPPPGQPTTLVWRDHAIDKVTLSLITHPAGGIVRIQLDDQPPVTIDLYSPSDKWRDLELSLAGGPARLVATLPYRETGLTIAASDREVTITRARVIWGEQVLADWRGALRVAASPAPLPVRSVAGGQIALRAAGNALSLLGRAGMHVLIAVLLGLSAVLAMLPALRYLERWLALITAGISIPLVATTALTRLDFDGDKAFWITLVAGGIATLVALLIELRGGGRRIRLLLPARGERGPLVGVVALGIITTLLLFAPAIAYPHWFTGHALTDSYFYINHAEAFRHESINRLQQPGWRAHANVEHLVAGIYNWAERTGDLLVLLNTALIYGESTRAAYTQLHFNFWLLLPLIGQCLLGRTLPRGASTWVGVVLLTCSGMLFSIFAQCYVAQYVSIILLLCSMWVGTVLDARLRSAKRESLTGSALLLALTLAATVCVFPAQFLMPVVVAVVMLATACALRSWHPMITLLGVGVASAVLGLAGLVPILAAPRDVPKYVERLNEIGRSAVFPFYRDPFVFGQVAYGIRDWVGVSRDSKQILPELLGADCEIWPLQRSSNSARNLMLVCVLVTLVGAVRGCRDPAGRTAAITLILFAAATAALGIAGQMYFAAKMMITCGVLALPALALGLEFVFARRGAFLQLVGGGLAGLLLFANVTTAWFETSPWMLPERHGAAVKRHMSVLDADVRELVESPLLRRDGMRAGHVAVIGDYAQARGTDRDRIVMGYLSSALAGSWVAFNPSVPQYRERRIEQALVFAGYALPEEIAARATLRFENAVARIYDIHPQ